MKPCWRNRKRIAALAVGELHNEEAQELRRHFKSCEACRGAFDELAGIRDELAATGRGMEMSRSTDFHRRLMRSLRKEPTRSSFGFWVAQFQSRRLALGFGLVIAGAIVFWAVHERGLSPGPSTATNRGQPASAHVRPQEPLAPSIANYRDAAERSFDALDDLLTDQALRCSPATSLYTASTLAWLNPLSQSGALEGAVQR